MRCKRCLDCVCRRKGGASDVSTDTAKPEGLADVDDASMLQWCQFLDFDAYADEWAQVATSLGSEALVPVLEQLQLPQIPYWNTVAHDTSAWAATSYSAMHAHTLVASVPVQA